MGHATLERVRLFGTRSADYIRASGHSGCIATEVVLQAKQAEYMTAPERFAEMPDFSLAPRAPSIHDPSPTALQSKAIAIDDDLRGTLRNFFGLKVGVVGSVKFEVRIKELVENLPDLAVLVEPLLVVRRVLREQLAVTAAADHHAGR